MNITEIKKLNLKDGDILFIPKNSGINIECFVDTVAQVFGNINFLIGEGEKDGIDSIKVISTSELRKGKND